MWNNPLVIAIVVCCFLITLFAFRSFDSQGCVIVLTGESIRVVGCSLSPEHIVALSHLKVLQVDL
uniref:Movement protein TGBp3 n=1 Tax=Blueberry scorch virus TaxID=31722 RepID=A0A0E3KS01_BBSCV|nr:triple gene block protein 3 [Blueberry scorch virus]AKA93833.1 triple gene block protein 3 [Blueberry scorch virus]AKA93836.1 triple gene block protein 3 [Blueberry scorch virus]AKA93839.1 triple gene block protein 3 [Blueberry scorch virus]AKA93842.1 triple gene block protein 3 [Blueberry scorch virus]